MGNTSLKKKFFKRYHKFGYWLIGGKDNKTIVRVFAVKRTGQHAILNWLMQQWKGSISFHNNVAVGQPILQSSHNHETRLRLPVINPLLLYNHEDVKISDAVKYDPYSEKGFGRYHRKFDVVIVRDPFNCFASRMNARWAWDNLFVENETIRNNVISTWKEHAREFCNESSQLQNRILINYNLWISDFDYRKKLAEQLGLHFTDIGFEHTPHYGLGSSFDGLEGVKDKANLLERWKTFEDDPLFNSIFKERELIELSSAVFGFVPEKYS